jgi:transcription elongation factor
VPCRAAITPPIFLTPGVETLGGKYELHDLVQLDAHTAGVIVGIDKDTARVLTNQSTLQKNDIRLCRVGARAGGVV